eukprot:1110343-Amphidinium_carterae.1
MEAQMAEQDRNHLAITSLSANAKKRCAKCYLHDVLCECMKYLKRCLMVTSSSSPWIDYAI